MSKSRSFDYGWVVVGAGAMMTCVGFGAMLSLAVFLQPISEAMGWSRSGVSAAATIDFLCMGLAAFFWGALSDRFGTRIVVLADGTVSESFSGDDITTERVLSRMLPARAATAVGGPL